MPIMNLMYLFAVATIVALLAVHGKAALEQGLDYPQTAFTSTAGP
jgi:hypothetical protein